MKRLILVFMFIAAAGLVLAQAPAGGGQRGGGQGGGQRGAGGPGRGAPPAATGPIADAVNAIVEAVNKQDAAALAKAITPDAQYLDEDGHMPPASAWIPRLVGGMPKKLTITNLRVGQPTPDTGWAAFNYTLEEAAGQIKGTNSMLFKKNGNDWQAVLVHGAVNTPAFPAH